MNAVATPTTAVTTATDVVGAAPEGRGRDTVLDLVRAGALVVVVAWHWAFTTLRWDDGPRIGNPTGETPGLWLATWCLQVMPLFFLVGGSLHASSLRRATTTRDDAAFVRGRFGRLVPPVLPLLALAVAVGLGGAALGRDDVVRGVVLMITPLWFLATYLVLVLLAPLARRVHRSCGLWAVSAGAVLVAVVDRLTWAGHIDGVAPMLAEYVLTWAVVHQLGFHLGSLRSGPRTARWATCLGGFALLAVGVRWLGYPPSMVGTHTDPISNMSPPNLMVVFLALAQMGLLAIADPHLRRWTDRHRGLLGTAGAWSMTVYVWHMLALAAFWGIAVVVIGPVHDRVDGTWWLQRPVWLVGPLLVALPLFSLTRPDRGPRRAA
ncbi:acyltransferase family protein [Dermatobacter hominis]|uniref:acyltransferase family protein n=1 Tax=Dermatobacter hominis TaxID=2884263 RepID=UPI001D0FD23B|nr:acyltransferase [Dermatobacter hominis]UDY37993.1 acyltransferase [Dermatobacter hominis]